MATFAEYILNEPNFIKKVEIAHVLKKKENSIFFNNSVIMKAEIAREFVDIMRLDVDKNVLVTACLMYSALKVESDDEEEKTFFAEWEFFKSLGFDEEFAKICTEYDRKRKISPIDKREKESDILEIVDQYTELLLNNQDRLGYSIEEAWFMIKNDNLKGSGNRYLYLFEEFLGVMEDIKVNKLGLLTRFQKEMNCLTKNDISGATRELYNNQERMEKAFAEREKELIYGGNLIEEIDKAKRKLELLKTAPMLPGFTIEDLDDD